MLRPSHTGTAFQADRRRLRSSLTSVLRAVRSFVLDGLLRLYGPGLQGRSPENLTSLVTRIAAPVLLQFDLVLDRLAFSATTPSLTPGTSLPSD